MEEGPQVQSAGREARYVSRSVVPPLEVFTHSLAVQIKCASFTVFCSTVRLDGGKAKHATWNTGLNALFVTGR
jgi:hypothetical protein